MKKLLSVIIIVFVLSTVLAGCGSGGSEDMNSDDAEGWDSDGSENADSDPVYDSEEEGIGIPDGVPAKPQGHYVFHPKVCSVYMEELFGKTMCETWYNVVDAVMAGIAPMTTHPTSGVTSGSTVTITTSIRPMFSKTWTLCITS